MSASAVSVRQLLALGAIATLALAGQGCGGDATADSDGDRIAALVTELREDFDAGDLEAVCEGLSNAARRQLAPGAPGADCAKDLRGVFAPGQARRTGAGAIEPKVLGVEIDGERAVARVRLTRRAVAQIPLAREDGDWKLDSVTGARPPRARTTEQPPPMSDPVEVTALDIRGPRPKRCPNVDRSIYPEISGGCSFGSSYGRLDYTMLTVLGSYRLGNCNTTFHGHTDARGRAAIESMYLTGPDPCWDVEACRFRGFAADEMPWESQLHPAGGAFRLRIDMCIDACELVTQLRWCPGKFAGELDGKIYRTPGDWQGSFDHAQLGGSGLEVDGTFDVSPTDFMLRKSGS